ncbi:sensor histidine kinase [Bifidobacterium eulemuris]|uniref:Sensor-like histidine kinase SenX3 n=1 Tax=Bifidobacterium eulemuris TaxID=1765219 RepID=A0A261GCB9_9BIFI|nr:HAMP domain-containing sensor histidine kinase [Bifidobacterium eulemuris]OZG69054.1 two-component system sensor histidine kinase [Bifidobacterium eulemuris]QOL31420.1 HAMP domain-containing histidine kinase [Bifidobacterium eulemuris]
MVHLAFYVLFPVFYTQQIRTGLDRDVAVIGEMLRTSDRESGEEFLRTYAKRNQLGVLAEFDGETVSFQEGTIAVLDFLDSGEELSVQGSGEVETILTAHGEEELTDGTAVRFQVMESTAPVKEAGRITRLVLPVTVLLSLAISFAFSWLYSRKVTRPVLAMMEETREMKVNFLRSASHDLKTPLAAQRILLENMLLGVGKYQDRDKYLEEAIKQVDQLTDMVKEILDTSRMSEIYQETSRVSITGKLHSMVKEQEMRIQRKGLEVELKLPERYDVTMNETLADCILGNLIDNAVKYCDDGGRVEIALEENVLRIRNSCVPLQEEELEQIFEAFYRPEYSRHTHAEGNGLGLYVVREGLRLSEIPYTFQAEEDGMCFQMNLKTVRNFI